MKKIIKRSYHHYERWEDWKHGLYRINSKINDPILITKSIKLLRNLDNLYEMMKKVSKEWKYATEENLSNINRNRQAWLGQAACCLNHGAPENLTKEAWHKLTENEQNQANAIADRVIKEWENLYLLKKSDQLTLF